MEQEKALALAELLRAGDELKQRACALEQALDYRSFIGNRGRAINIARDALRTAIESYRRAARACRVND